MHKRVAEALRYVRSTMSAEAQPELGDEKGVLAEERARRLVLQEVFWAAKEDDAELPQVRGGNRQLVEVVFDIISEDVERLPQYHRSSVEHRENPHELSHRGLVLSRPF